ncbi:hypothetical protein EB001_19910 [bacterium]|nr:hypothetical protein [bacterium]
MRYPYKYAMPVDPKVLEHDFESHELVDDIPSFVKLLKSVNPDTYGTIATEVNKFTYELWGHVEVRKGISLRDREKLLPVFKEFSRLSEEYNLKKPTTLYRGVNIPQFYNKLLEESFGDQVGEIDLDQYKKVKDVFEGLAYGLRSWSDYEHTAESFTDFKLESIIFILKNPSPHIVLNGLALHKLNRKVKSEVKPVDIDEFIVQLKNPKVLSAKRLKIEDDWGAEHYYWKVLIDEG